MFSPSAVAELPEPARRWLEHAIPSGTPLWATAELSMTGEIKLGAWRRFSARQILSPPRGFLWAATTRLFGLPVTGYDRLSSGTGELRWRLAGMVPVVSAAGPDVALSAAGRLAGEAVLVPTSFRAASWTPGADHDRVRMTWTIDGTEETTELHIAADGRLLGARMQRWGDPDRSGSYGRHPFGVTIEAEATFAGITIPSVLRAGWWWGTDRQDEGEFFRARITDASFS